MFSRYNSHSSVCLQTAVTLDPALTDMVLSDGFVGLGGPLQAMVFDMTFVCGYSVSEASRIFSKREGSQAVLHHRKSGLECHIQQLDM